jgi:spore maturation protein CgeB
MLGRLSTLRGKSVSISSRNADKILLVETWDTHLYAQPFYDRLRELGVEVLRFEERRYFEGSLLRSGWLRAQNKFRFGPAVQRLNRELLERVHAERPGVVFVFRGGHIFPETIIAMKRLGAWVIAWHNDDPLSPRVPPYVWRNFVKAIPLYDRLFAYRLSNVEEFRARGCSRVELLRSNYLRELNHPVGDEALEKSAYRCEVAFIGHWEDDGREQLVGALAAEPNLDFRLWGTLWDRASNAAVLRRRFGPIKPIYGDYNLALASAGIALVFLSKLNRDTYTRRCFEIPAAGTFMLAEHSDDLASLFKEGVEAEFFRSQEELLEKVRRYTANPEARKRIAEAGRERLLRDGHEALDRARQVLTRLREDLAGPERSP